MLTWIKTNPYLALAFVVLVAAGSLTGIYFVRRNKRQSSGAEGPVLPATTHPGKNGAFGRVTSGVTNGVRQLLHKDAPTPSPQEMLQTAQTLITTAEALIASGLVPAESHADTDARLRTAQELSASR